jgi:UDP-2,3-diacylglucosamine pyrophosphatase LpxH
MHQELILDIRWDARGNKSLHFPFMSISDVHLGTRHSRAKKLSHMLNCTVADKFYLVGDIVDGEQMCEKGRWNFGDWHRQVVGHVCRKAGRGSCVTYIPGNHDSGIRRQKVECDGEKRQHRNLCGRNIYGIQIEELAYFTDSQGRMLKLIHGDQYDRTLGTCGSLGDAALELMAHADTGFQLLPGCDHISLAAKGKRATKKIIDRLWGIRKQIAEDVDRNGLLHGIVTGHSHMSEIGRTPGGKFALNDGCCTEHVEALVQDRNGKFAILEWHQEYVNITEENPKIHNRLTLQKRFLHWKDMGLDWFQQPPRLVEDEYMEKADRLIRLFYRMWPPKERKHLKEAAQLARAVDEVIIGLPDQTAHQLYASWSKKKYRRIRRMAEVMRLTGEIAESAGYLPLPNPARDRRQAAARAPLVVDVPRVGAPILAAS